MTDKRLTWERQVGSGAELPADLPYMPSEMFPRKQKELPVLLVTLRKNILMEFDPIRRNSWLSLPLLLQTSSRTEISMGTHSNSAFTSCCPPLWYVCNQKKVWLCAPSEWCALVPYLLPQCSHAWRPCTVPPGSSPEFSPSWLPRIATILWVRDQTPLALAADFQMWLGGPHGQASAVP